MPTIPRSRACGSRCSRSSASRLRPVADAGFGEIPNVGHQGGSILGLSKYSKNLDAAWLFMQWACSKEIMTRCTLLGGFAPMRISSFDDPRVKAKAVVGPGTTRHLEMVKWTIDNVMASEPDMPLWAGFSNNEIPVELGKLLTGQDYRRRCQEVHGQRRKPDRQGRRRRGPLVILRNWRRRLRAASAFLSRMK